MPCSAPRGTRTHNPRLERLRGEAEGTDLARNGVESNAHCSQTDYACTMIILMPRSDLAGHAGFFYVYGKESQHGVS